MRSLILAGGGLKIAYQAGCMQVLLDEAGLTFDYVDAASGGFYNAALLADGYSGTQIADIWRRMDPRDFFSLNWRKYYRSFWAPSIATSDGARRVFRDDWKLDFTRIKQAQGRTYTFNVYNFSQKRVMVKQQHEMSEELLLACTALVMWFPPVTMNGEILIDAVYARDANVTEAVRLGADEIWAIWTVSDRPEYRDGFLAQYFHIIEAAADARFFEEWNEIARVNDAISEHGSDLSRDRTDLRLTEESTPKVGNPSHLLDERRSPSI